MTWIDWAIVACLAYATLLPTAIVIRQHLWIRNERELLKCQQRLRAERDRLKPDLAGAGGAFTLTGGVGGPDLAAQSADSEIQAGVVYWDGRLP
jgi:hypothetical protein